MGTEVVDKVQQTTQDERAYIMTFRDGVVPFRIKGFKHRGDLRSARNRAFKHGTIMGYKNIWVFPLFSDLSEDEKSHSSEGPSDVSQREFQKDRTV